MQTSTTAKVQVTLEVTVGSTWGDECTQRQVFDQAARAAINMVKTMVGCRTSNDMRIVSDVKVETVTKAYP